MNTTIKISFFVFLFGCFSGLIMCDAAWAELQASPYLITGHGGVSASYIDGVWDMHAAEEVSGGHEADEVLFYVNQYAEVPSDNYSSDWHSWLGTTPGDAIYVVPQTLEAGLPYFGFNLHGMDEDDKAALAAWMPTDTRVVCEEAEAWMRVDLVSVTGLDGAAAPGEFSMWTTGSAGLDAVWMSTAETPAEGNSFYLDVEHGHSHVNWGFTEPGIYEIEFQASTYLATDPGTLITSPATTYYFGVLTSVPEPSVLALVIGMAFAGMLATRRRDRR